MQANKDHDVYSDFFSSTRKYKAEDYHAECVQYVALSCCLSVKDTYQAFFGVLIDLIIGFLGLSIK
jgi:hypothetical protein